MFKYLFLLSGIVCIENGDPIVGAKIYNECDTTYTNFEGKFEIEAEDKYVNISYISYEDKLDSILNDDSIIILKEVNL